VNWSSLPNLRLQQAAQANLLLLLSDWQTFSGAFQLAWRRCLRPGSQIMIRGLLANVAFPNERFGWLRDERWLQTQSELEHQKPTMGEAKLLSRKQMRLSQLECVLGIATLRIPARILSHEGEAETCSGWSCEACQMSAVTIALESTLGDEEPFSHHQKRHSSAVRLHLEAQSRFGFQAQYGLGHCDEEIHFACCDESHQSPASLALIFLPSRPDGGTRCF